MLQIERGLREKVLTTFDSEMPLLPTALDWKNCYWTRLQMAKGLVLVHRQRALARNSFRTPAPVLDCPRKKVLGSEPLNRFHRTVSNWKGLSWDLRMDSRQMSPMLAPGWSQTEMPPYWQLHQMLMHSEQAPHQRVKGRERENYQTSMEPALSSLSHARNCSLRPWCIDLARRIYRVVDYLLTDFVWCWRSMPPQQTRCLLRTPIGSLRPWMVQIQTVRMRSSQQQQ